MYYGDVRSIVLRYGRQGRVVFGASRYGKLGSGRLGMAIKVRCGVVSYNLKFLP